MGDVLILPIQLRSSAQADRLGADLIAAHERNLDLGSRGAHMKAGGAQLLELSCKLENNIEDLDRFLAKSGMRGQAVSESLRSLLTMVRELAEAAQRCQL